MRLEPVGPRGPPGALLRCTRSEPFVGTHAQIVRRGPIDPEIAMRVPRLADDPGIVATTGENERDLGIRQVVNLVDRMPRRNMVALRRYYEQRCANVADRDRTVVDLIPAARQIVVQE